MAQSARPSLTYYFVAVLVLVPGILVAQVQHQGILTVNHGVPSVCLQPFTHLLTDDCGNTLGLVSSQMDLNAFLGQNVTVSGPDIDANCVLIDVQSATATPAASCAQLEGSIEVLTGGSPCSEPVSHVLLDENCEPSLYLTGGSLLTSSAPGLSLQDLEGQRVVLEALDLSEPGCPLANPHRTLSALDCPCELEINTLQVHDGADTWLEWDPLPAGCPVNYDVIRGFVWDITQEANQVDLSFVQCLMGDTLESSTFAGPRDSESPLFDDLFYYLVRVDLPPESTYGYSSSGMERHPFAGDCP